MVNIEIQAFADYLLAANSSFFEYAEPFAMKDEKGAVVVRDKTLGRYVGIREKGIFFYLRFNTENEISYRPGRNTGYKNTEATVSLRLVVCAKRFDAYEVEEKLRSDMMLYTRQVELKTAVLDSIKVFIQETGKSDRYSDKRQYMAMDLNLTFDVLTNPCLPQIEQP